MRRSRRRCQDRRRGGERRRHGCRRLLSRSVSLTWFTSGLFLHTHLPSTILLPPTTSSLPPKVESTFCLWRCFSHTYVAMILNLGSAREVGEFKQRRSSSTIQEPKHPRTKVEEEEERSRPPRPRQLQTNSNNHLVELLITITINRLKLRRRLPIPSLRLPPLMRLDPPLQIPILAHDLHRQRLVAPRDRASRLSILEVIPDRRTREIVRTDRTARERGQ